MQTETTYGPETTAWSALESLAPTLHSQSIGELFGKNTNRFEEFSIEACGMLFDFSRQKLSTEALLQLLELAQQTNVVSAINDMFEGRQINVTEQRPALHVALRRPASKPLVVNEYDIMADVENERQKMRDFSERLEAGELKGWTGKIITDVVNIGIGGSDLGIAMVVEALAEYRLPGISVHFISNVDGVDLVHVLKIIDPETTLFVICSKSFTTLETLTNAQAVRHWLLDHGGEAAVATQCLAVSTNHQAMDEFGIGESNRLAMWDWVGGRFSLWSAVGLTIALAIGWRNFSAMLRGAHEMDKHFLAAPLKENLPVVLGLIGIWNRNFLHANSHAVLPYDDHLARFPAFLQQLEMESNGKSVRHDGEPVECDTCPIIWGESGSNAQHSFFQLLHQGTEQVAMDFIATRRSAVNQSEPHQIAIDNCLAQAWALAAGDPQEASNHPHQQYPGSKPNSLIALDSLGPESLGKLIALYEHKVFVQGVVWDVNSFDQFGVELGKRLARELGRSSSGVVPAEIAGALQWLHR